MGIDCGPAPGVDPSWYEEYGIRRAFWRQRCLELEEARKKAMPPFPWVRLLGAFGFWLAAVGSMPAFAALLAGFALELPGGRILPWWVLLGWGSMAPMEAGACCVMAVLGWREFVTWMLGWPRWEVPPDPPPPI